MTPSYTDSQPDLLMATDWLADNITQPATKVVDTRLPEAYAEGHIPHALNLPLPALQTVREGVPEMLVDSDELEARLGQMGIRETDTVVLYDSMWGLPSARVFWALECLGHARLYILDGGLDRWQQEGRSLAHNAPPTTPVTYRAQPVDAAEASHAWLRDRLNHPDLVVVDTRTPTEYAAGHLPGAVNWDWMNAVPPGSSSVVRPAEELRPELEALGITPDREVVVYCRSGARSAHTYFTLRYLGYPRVRNYDGSWLAWSLKEGDRE
jgi:thiosulfate/3-mercaptopyruvate sulfurtransferase